VQEARHYRKIFGGGMRQAGILAAAGLYALEHHLPELAQDHEKALRLAGLLQEVPGFDIDMDTVQTNIVIISVARAGRSSAEILSILKQHGVLLSQGNYQGIRAVTHRDLTLQDVLRAGELIRSVLKPPKNPS
jgi:threonine aldolase